MKKLHRLGFGGLLLLLGILTGCSQLFPNDPLKDSSDTLELSGTSAWLIAAQGQGGSPNCVRDLAPGQAKKLAEKALKDKREIQLLQQALERRGKKLVLSKAHGCQVKGKLGGQGLSTQQEAATEATLVEVPAGSDAALYLLENETVDEGNYWAALRESAEGGETLVHIEVGLASDTGVQGLSTEPGEAKLFLPDELGTQEVASDLEQLLAESATMSAGVRALQTEALDWANAEVVLDKTSVTVNADGSEEMEALVVVPQMESTTQQLWSRSRPSIDVERATHVKVTVRRTPPSPSNPRPQLQVVRPTPEQPVVLPIVKKGVELKPAFQYCPYRHYGRLSSFSRVMCQDSWKQWYGKQWASNAVQSKVLQASGAAASSDTYNITYARDGKRGIDLLAAGFDNLNPSDLQRMFDYVATTNQASILVQLPSEVLQRWEQAQPLFNGISDEQFTTWLRALAEAMQQGTFDQVYDQLLTQGITQLEEAIMVLNGTNDRNIAKSIIREMAQKLPKPRTSLTATLFPSNVEQAIIDYMNLARDHLERVFLNLQASREISELLLTGFGLGKIVEKICGTVSPVCSKFVEDTLSAILPKQPYAVINELMNLWDRVISNLELVDPTGNVALKFSDAMNTIIQWFKFGNLTFWRLGPEQPGHQPAEPGLTEDKLEAVS